MGIPGFSLWFSSKNKEAYVPLDTVRVDHLYIDLNSVLHTVLRRGECCWWLAAGGGFWLGCRADACTCMGHAHACLERVCMRWHGGGRSVSGRDHP